jgi:hypothetical protein
MFWSNWLSFNWFDEHLLRTCSKWANTYIFISNVNMNNKKQLHYIYVYEVSASKSSFYKTKDRHLHVLLYWIHVWIGSCLNVLLHGNQHLCGNLLIHRVVEMADNWNISLWKTFGFEHREWKAGTCMMMVIEPFDGHPKSCSAFTKHLCCNS